MNHKITFHLDGSGVYYDPNEPIHLDALLAWALAPHQGIRHLDRSTKPDLVRLPLMMTEINGHKVWRASALFPVGQTGESVWYWRKRFRQSRCEIATGSPNLTNGTYRDWQMPMPLLLCRRMVAYAAGSGKEIRRVLKKEIRYLGKKRAHGHGKIISIDVEPQDEDMSLVSSGRAMRWIPDPNGQRMVRPIPPYWHPHGAIRCCEIGDTP